MNIAAIEWEIGARADFVLSAAGEGAQFTLIKATGFGRDELEMTGDQGREEDESEEAGGFCHVALFVLGGERWD